MKTKLILLNGPPNCGKGSGLNYAKDKTFGCINPVSFKKPLFDMVLSLFNISSDEFFRCYNDRELKDVPHPDLMITPESYVKLCRAKKSTWLHTGVDDYTAMKPISPRDSMIYVSECVAKPLFGPDVFGKRLLAQIKDGYINVAEDSGFMSEVIPLVKELGEDNVSIIAIYRDGCSFTGDSRKYLNNNYTTYNAVINNNSCEKDYNKELLSTILDLGSR